MALTDGVTFWGVDSATAASFGPVGKYATLYDAVVSSDGAGRTPSFWGRYVGHPTASFNLTSDEASFLHSHNCKILLIYGGTTAQTVGSYQDGVNAASNAINYITNNKLAVPGGKSVWIYCDIEYPSMSPTADFFRGWSDTMFNSSYGGAGGVYGNTINDAKHNPQFNTPYCNAYAADSNMRVGSAPALVYTDQPIQCVGPSCNPQTLASTPPAFSKAEAPPCGAPTVLFQYAQQLTIAKMKNAVDFDLTNGAGFAGMW